MNNKECIERLRSELYSSNPLPRDEFWEAIDHAIARLEMLDRLKEWAKIRQKYWSAICLRMTDEDRRSKAAHRIIGRQAELYSLEEFLTGDEQSLKILAEVEE